MRININTNMTIYIYMYIYMCVYTYIHMSLFVYMRIAHVHKWCKGMCMDVYTCTHLRIYPCMCLCIYMFTHPNGGARSTPQFRVLADIDPGGGQKKLKHGDFKKNL